MAAPSLAGLEMDALDIIGPDHYQQHGYPHAEWTLLRREAPISWFDRHEGPPFWAVTRHEDIVFLSKQPKRFQNGPRLAVFDAPFAFRVDRRPNPHLAFGIGEHFCLGANVARLELRVMFQQLAERLQEVELRGPAERLRSSFLGGVKHMPVRWQLRRA